MFSTAEISGAARGPYLGSGCRRGPRWSGSEGCSVTWWKAGAGRAASPRWWGACAGLRACSCCRTGPGDLGHTDTGVARRKMMLPVFSPPALHSKGLKRFLELYSKAVSHFSCQTGRTPNVSRAMQNITLPTVCTQHCLQKPVGKYKGV